MSPVYRNTKAGLILTVQLGSTLCMSYSIIGLTFETNVIFGGAVDIVIYGTAVFLNKKQFISRHK